MEYYALTMLAIMVYNLVQVAETKKAIPLPNLIVTGLFAIVAIIQRGSISDTFIIIITIFALNPPIFARKGGYFYKEGKNISVLWNSHLCSNVSFQHIGRTITIENIATLGPSTTTLIIMVILKEEELICKIGGPKYRTNPCSKSFRNKLIEISREALQCYLKRGFTHTAILTGRVSYMDSLVRENIADYLSSPEGEAEAPKIESINIYLHEGP